MNHELNTDTTDLLAEIKARYHQLSDPSLSVEKHHLVSNIATDLKTDPITVAQALAYFETTNHTRCWIDNVSSTSHLLVVTLGSSGRTLYLSLADIVRLTPPIHTSSREGA